MSVGRLQVSYFLFATMFVLGTGLGYLIAYVSGSQPSFVPLISAVLGLAVAFLGPLWQAIFINAPKLSVELTAIKRTISQTAAPSVSDDPELAILYRRSRLPYPSERLFFVDEGPTLSSRRSSRRPTLSDLDELFQSAKQSLRELPAQIEERKAELARVASLTPSSFSKYDCDILNRPIDPEVEYDPAHVEDNISAFTKAYQERLAEMEKRYADLQSGMPAAERKIEIIRRNLTEESSLFTISASLVNSGRSNTAIKVPALLRVSIGEGNYIDIKLTLKDFEDKSEITANGTRIVIFDSEEISSLPEEDRKLINTYWGQSVRSNLFIEDIHGRIYSSNSIAFAEGLYQKIIYDRLGRAASTIKSK